MKRLFFTCGLFFIMGVLFAQTKYQASNTKVTMEGTSTLHDWHMTSEQGVTNVSFSFDGASLTAMPSLIFSIPVETLKSGTKGLNKNAYKALNAEKHPTITFASSAYTIRANGTNSWVVSIKGKLTIAGVSKDVVFAVVCNVNPTDQSIAANGSYKLKMSDFDVDAPSFMFGAMKTGDEVNIKFNAVLHK